MKFENNYDNSIDSKQFEHGGNLFKAFNKNNNDYDILNFFNEAKKKIDFSANINPLGLSKNALCILKNTKLLKFLIENYPEVYPERLTNKLCDYHYVHNANIAISAGATNLIYKILSVFKPENVLIAEPSFTEYKRVCSVLKINTVHQCTCFEEEFKLINNNLTEFIDKIKNLRENDFIFIASPSNPAGVITPIGTIKEILKLCRNKNIYLILDESFMDFKEEYSSKHLIEEFDNLIVLRSMTKFFAIPGERLGYILSCKKNILKIINTAVPWEISGLASALAIASLSDKKYIADTIQCVDKLKEEMYNDLLKFKVFKIIYGEANFLLIKIKTENNSNNYQSRNYNYYNQNNYGYHNNYYSNNIVNKINSETYQNISDSALNLKNYLLNSDILIRYAGNYNCLDDSFFRIAIKKRKENKILIDKLKKYVNQTSP
ncbi:MAG: pyridoxal phosphate-dependent aminotransferase [bacterium]